MTLLYQLSYLSMVERAGLEPATRGSTSEVTVSYTTSFYLFKRRKTITVFLALYQLSYVPRRERVDSNHRPLALHAK